MWLHISFISKNCQKTHLTISQTGKSKQCVKKSMHTFRSEQIPYEIELSLIAMAMAVTLNHDAT
jgi:hypothetical protein